MSFFNTENNTDKLSEPWQDPQGFAVAMQPLALHNLSFGLNEYKESKKVPVPLSKVFKHIPYSK